MIRQPQFSMLQLRQLLNMATRTFLTVGIAVIALRGTIAGAQVAPPIPPVPHPPRMPADVRSNIHAGDFDFTGLVGIDRWSGVRSSDIARLTQNAAEAELRMGQLAHRLGSFSQPGLSADLAGLAGLSNLRSLGEMRSLSGLTGLASIASDIAPLTGYLSGFGSGDSYGSSGRSYALPPDGWQIKDPADSLYREARKALSNDSYRRASSLYRQIRTNYPKSVYTADAGYWEAFSLQRLGNQEDLRAALATLNTQMSKFPNASTTSEARSLQVRLEGQLARMGDAKAAGNVGDNVVRTNNASCPNDSEDERIDALDALMQMDAASALPILKKVLARRDECSANLRKKAIWLVSTRRAPEALDIMINSVRTDPDKDVRETAIFWMANYPSERTTDLLIELAKGGGDVALRNRAVYSLAQVRSAKSIQALKDVVLDNSAPIELRGDAVFWLVNAGHGTRGYATTVGGFGQSGASGVTATIGSTGGSGQTGVTTARGGNAVGTGTSVSSGSGSNVNVVNSNATSGEDMVPFLKEVYAKVDNNQLRERVLQAAMQMRNESARNWMVEIALNPRESSDARKSAVYAAGIGGATTDQLQSIYEKSNDVDVRTQVLWMYSTRKTDGVDKLIAIVRNEKNPELRKQAIFWVSRVKDPRVAQLLQEIIDK